MTEAQRDKAVRFAALHRPGDPLILYNVWDPGSARAVARAGARAIATGSWSVAAAFGFEDGETLPRELAIENIGRIAAAVDLPVTIDLEGGYGEPPEIVAETVKRAVEAGAVGCNLEDGIVGGEGMHPAGRQRERLAAARAAADRAGIPFFLNARTDCFLLAAPADHAARVEEAIARARLYADAGASGLFVPGLKDEALLARICAQSPLPVNAMAAPDGPGRARLAELGVARISHGPGPYRRYADQLRVWAAEAMAD